MSKSYRANANVVIGSKNSKTRTVIKKGNVLNEESYGKLGKKTKKRFKEVTAVEVKVTGADPAKDAEPVKDADKDKGKGK